MHRLFITGGSGFIGSHFHQSVQEDLIVNLDLVAPEFPYRSRYVAGDVREPHSVNAALAENPSSTIICLAAEHRDFGITSEAYFMTNDYGTQVICEAAARHGVKKIVFFSSVAVYGNALEPTTEETSPAPVSPYGASKLAGEEALRRWVAGDAERSVVVMRPTVVYGIRNRANMLRLILQIDGNRYVNIGEAANIKSISFVNNVVDATLFLIKRMQPGFHVYNYADDPQLSVREITETVASALGKKRPMSAPYGLAIAGALPFDLAIAMTGRDFPVSTMRIKKLCTETHHAADKILRAGFTPKYSNVEGLRLMVAWYLNEKRVGNTPTVLTASSG